MINIDALPNILTMTVTIGMADDHQLFLKSLISLVNGFNKYTVVAEALDGGELLKRLEALSEKPSIVLLDVNMPGMGGVEAAQKIASLYPDIKLVALSGKDDDTTIINMLRAGCVAYLLKDIHPDELERALDEIARKGFYNADTANINYRRLLLQDHKNEKLKLTDRELTFLQMACSDLTYKQIASKMNLAERTIDGYRESLFEKLNVQSRVGMAMEAIRRQLIQI